MFHAIHWTELNFPPACFQLTVEQLELIVRRTSCSITQQLKTALKNTAEAGKLYKSISESHVKVLNGAWHESFSLLEEIKDDPEPPGNKPRVCVVRRLPLPVSDPTLTCATFGGLRQSLLKSTGCVCLREFCALCDGSPSEHSRQRLCPTSIWILYKVHWSKNPHYFLHLSIKHLKTPFSVKHPSICSRSALICLITQSAICLINWWIDCECFSGWSCPTHTFKNLLLLGQLRQWL